MFLSFFGKDKKKKRNGNQKKKIKLEVSFRRFCKQNDLFVFFEQTRKAYDNLRFEFTHFIAAGTTIITRHTLYGSIIEDASNESALGHFSTIWEVKDGKLYRGYEISQQADESNAQSMASYS